MSLVMARFWVRQFALFFGRFFFWWIWIFTAMSEEDMRD